VSDAVVGSDVPSGWVTEEDTSLVIVVGSVSSSTASPCTTATGIVAVAPGWTSPLNV